MAGGKVPLTFRLYKGDEFLREEKLTLPVIKVGKLSSSHLRLDDKNVSRMHALIEVTGPSDVSIIDLSSTTGTFVNGQKVNKAKLQSGDSIVIGETRIEVTVGGAEEDDDLPTRVQAGPAPGSVADPVTPPGPRPAPPAPPAPPPAAAYASAPVAPTIVGAPGAPTAGFAAGPTAARRPAPAAPTLSRNVPAPFGMQQPMAQSGFVQGALAEQVEEPGARAVEVAAMIGNSVVSVKHVMNPRNSGNVSTGTKVLFVLAAAWLAMGLVGFVAGYSNSDYNEAKKHQWIEVEKRPSWAFRPQKLAVSNDIMVFVGFPLGIAFLAAALLRMREEKLTNPWFRIGTDQENEFPTSESPVSSFALVAPRGDDFVFNFSQGMEGEMQVDGQSTSLAELQAQGRATPSTTAPGGLEVQIPQKARIRVKSGLATFLVTSVPQPRRHPVPLFAALESRVLLFFAASAAVHLGLWALVRTVPPDQDTAPTDMAVNEDTTNKAQMTSIEDPPPPEEEKLEEDGEDESGGTGTAMQLTEGKMGKKDSDRAAGQFNMKKNAEQEQLARQQAIEQARTAGVLGAAALNQGGAFASITGTGDISSGFDDLDIQGGLLGDQPGEMAGGFGFGRSGFGPGGGGTGWGTIGTGRYGTIGHGSGTGQGYGVGSGRGGMRGRQAAVPQVRIGQPSTVGDLDKAIIRRYIKRNITKITYCYEKELLAAPSLAGVVATQFFITPSGTVAASNASGVDANVASCVAAVIKGIEFPKPKGGGGVQVNYPFTFRTGG